MELTDKSLALFLAYAKDADNWDGTPMVGGNVGGSKADAGNLTDLKKAGLLTTVVDGGCAWVRFTPAGIAHAQHHGLDLSWA